MAKKIKVAVIFGGASNEHEVSLLSAYNVIKSIPADKYEVICVGITKKGRWLRYPGDPEGIKTGAWETDPDCVPAIISPDPIHRGLIVIEDEDCEANIVKIDAVFPVLHGKNGEDGTIQGLLTMSKIPYVGCKVASSANCMDKEYCHTLLDYNGIKTAKWRKIERNQLGSLDEVLKNIAIELKFPIFVKPANCGSSVGVSKAANIDEFKIAVKKAFSHDSKVIAEEFISGRELEVAVFGYDDIFASYAGEIKAANDFYDYDAKYIQEDSVCLIPADVTVEQSNKIRELAKKGYRALGCEGLARVDFFMSADGTIVLNEINTMPGFTDISMYPKMMQDLGMSQSYLVDKLIEQAILNN